jgi:hypothetical protein
MKNMIDRTIASSYRGVGEYTGMEWHGWKPFVGKQCGFVITQAAYGGDMAEEPLKCFAEYSGCTHTGTIIASCGAGTLDDFPEYAEEALRLGNAIRGGVVKKS